MLIFFLNLSRAVPPLANASALQIYGRCLLNAEKLNFLAGLFALRVRQLLGLVMLENYLYVIYKLCVYVVNDYELLPSYIPSSCLTSSIFSMTKSKSSLLWAADIWVRIRAAPFGTTG